MKKTILSITGNTATGTTTLTKEISKRFGSKEVLSEHYFKASPFFDNFLREPKKWAFHNQVFFLTEYLEEYLKVISDTNIGIVCLDYHIQELVIYSKGQYLSGYLTQEEFSTINRMQSLVLKNIPLPDLTIYLKCDSKTIADRLVKRNRLSEENIDVEYIDKLNNEFDLNFNSYDGPILYFSSNEYNFLKKDEIDYVIEKIKEACL